MGSTDEEARRAERAEKRAERKKKGQSSEEKEARRAERAKKRAERKKKGQDLAADFKKFITRGNVVDMAIGVIVGGAFQAIVTATVGILMSLCTWWIPGGLNELITVLPAITEAQRGPIGQRLTDADYQKAIAGDPKIAAYYYQVRSMWVTKTSAVINWGVWINALISFLTIALTLFIILKVFTSLKEKRAERKKAALEKYYLEHPEERPLPPEPAKPQPSEIELLGEIRDILAAKREKAGTD